MTTLKKLPFSRCKNTKYFQHMFVVTLKKRDFFVSSKWKNEIFGRNMFCPIIIQNRYALNFYFKNCSWYSDKKSNIPFQLCWRKVSNLFQTSSIHLFVDVVKLSIMRRKKFVPWGNVSRCKGKGHEFSLNFSLKILKI